LLVGNVAQKLSQPAICSGSRHSGQLGDKLKPMCNLYSITTNQAAIIALFRVINR
jgi:hypothetical protein